MDHIQRTAGAEATPAGPGSIIVTASDDSADRFGDKILVDGMLGGKRFGHGWQLANFQRNPTILLGHDSHSLPVGRATRLWTDEVAGRKRLRAEIAFSAANPLGEVVHGLFKEGSLTSVSVGFQPIATYVPGSEKEREKLGLGPNGRLFATSELWEISAVALPANPNATVGASALGRRDLDRVEAALREALIAAEKLQASRGDESLASTRRFVRLLEAYRRQ